MVASQPRNGSLRIQAFTSIEVLVVVAILALLIAILLPSLQRARRQARRVVCLSNLHQIHNATVAYSHHARDFFPDGDTLGRHTYRRAPGLRRGTGPMNLPETFGLAALLHRTRNLPGRSDVWNCPDTAPWMLEHRNTYAFSLAEMYAKKPWSTLMLRKSITTWQTWWVWDNYNMRPGDPGYVGPFGPGYALSAQEQASNFPHEYTAENRRTGQKAINVLYLDGHSAPRYLQHGQ